MDLTEAFGASIGAMFAISFILIAAVYTTYKYVQKHRQQQTSHGKTFDLHKVNVFVYFEKEKERSDQGHKTKHYTTKNLQNGKTTT